MICKDFQHRWNELLDAEALGTNALAPPGAARPLDEVEASLMAHAAGCPACRPIAARYQALRHAIRAWRQSPPAPPGDLIDRILSVPDQPAAAPGRSVARRTRADWSAHPHRIKLISGLAATILVAMAMATVLHRIARDPRGGRPDRAPHDLAFGGRPIEGAGQTPAASASPALHRALAEATSATWDLARSASGPAARISREVLVVTVQADGLGPERSGSTTAMRPTDGDRGLTDLTALVPAIEDLGSDGSGASAVLQGVGDQLSAGVRPLSSTARHAFGFLLGPPPARAGARPGGSNPSGARRG